MSSERAAWITESGCTLSGFQGQSEAGGHDHVSVDELVGALEEDELGQPCCERPEHCSVTTVMDDEVRVGQDVRLMHEALHV
ncbi:MAG TPA: hypothetical protein VIY28_04370 [Pseudonocardiaceae bacterium]